MRIFIFVFTLGIVWGMSAQAEVQGEQLEQKIAYTLISSEELAPVHSVLRGSLKTLLPEAEEVYLDYHCARAKELIAELEIEHIPYVIFDDSVALEEPFFHMVKNNMIDRQKGFYVIPEKMLRMGEVRLLGRKRIPRRLDIFVMSRCSGCDEAKEKLIKAVREQKLDIALKIRYQAKVDEFGVSSRFGAEEIREKLRQIVLQKYYPDKFWDYLILAQEKAKEEALSELGIPPEKIDARKDEALAMLKEDAREAELLDIKYVPAFLWENIYLISTLEGLKNHKPFNSRILEKQNIP